ncbi:MAG: tetratricopeptide repeat protein [Myxococcota bacterium]
MRLLSVGLLVASLSLVACDGPGPTTPPDDGDGAESLGPVDPLEAAAKKIAEGKPDEALAIVDAELATSPEDHELWFSKGVALRELGKVDEAMAAWDEALSREPDFFGALHAKGAVFLEREAWNDAITTLNAAAQAKPDYADVHYNLALAILGASAAGAREGDGIDGATKALSTAYDLDPKDVDVALALADLHIKRNRLDDAAPLLDGAAREKPDDPQIAAAQGRLALKRGDGQGALTAFERALAKSPGDAGFELGHAQALLRLNRSAEAEAELAALSKKAPESAVVWLEWGTALAKQGKLKPALEKMDEAVRRGPHLISAQVRRIGLLSDLGRCKDAKAALGTLRKTTRAPGALKVAEGAVAGCKR